MNTLQITVPRSYLPTKEEINAFARVCLPACLLARLLKNACMDLYAMLRVYRCRDMDELINFWTRSGLLVLMPEPDCCLRYHITAGTVGKTYWPLQRRIVLQWFLPQDAMHKCSICRHAASVCPSVRLSVTFVDHVKTNKRVFEIYLPSGSAADLNSLVLLPGGLLWMPY